MQPRHRRAALVGAAVFMLSAIVVPCAHAASQRTFVATSGVDNPTCALATPCRTFAAAIGATNTNGEVIVLDSGGYGPVTITQAVSIIAPPGVHAGISVFSGNGITVTLANFNDNVRLRGLSIVNQGASGSGIVFDGVGQLLVEDSVIAGFAASSATSGIYFHPSATSKLFVARTEVRASFWGINIEPQTTSVLATATLDEVTVASNECTAVLAQNTSHVVIRRSSFVNNQCSGLGTGTIAGTILLVSADDSDFSNNQILGVTPGDDAGQEFVTLTNCTVAHNSKGIHAGNASHVRLAGTSVVQNTALGLEYAGNGVIESQGNNFIWGNAVDGVAPTIVGSK